MMIAKTAKLQDVQNKGQRAVIVAVLAKLSAPISLEQLTTKVTATGQYNGKGTKGHVNKWAQEKAGGDLGSVRYHIRALAIEKRVTVTDGVAAAAKPKKAAKAKDVAPEPTAPEPTAPETPAEAAKDLEEMAAA